MPDAPVAILIAGASHCGKSTLAGRVGAALGWRVLSTDSLGRHPGRPWPEPRPEVAEIYDRLSDDTLFWLLQVHKQNMQPLLARLIGEAAQTGQQVVLEGSGLRPDGLVALQSSRVRAVCLLGEAELLTERIRAGAGYDGIAPGQRCLVDRFIARSLRDNDLYRAEARDRGVYCVDAVDAADVERACAELILWAGRHQ